MSNVTITREQRATLGAAMKAASALTAAGDKLATSTDAFVKACGGFATAQKILNAQLPDDSSWKTERESRTALYAVYNCVAAAKSRAAKAAKEASGEPAATRKARQTEGESAKEAGGAQAPQAQAPSKPATDADIAAVLLAMGSERIAQAIREQTFCLSAHAVGILKDVIGALSESVKAPRKAPDKAPRKAPAKRAK